MHRLYDLFIRPHETAAQDQRREFLTNTLLVSFGSLAAIDSFLSLLNQPALAIQSDCWAGLPVCAILFSLLYVSRRYDYRWGAYGFLLVLIALALWVCITYGPSSTMAELIVASVIAISGILLRAQLIISTSLGISGAIVAISYAQLKDWVTPNLLWRQHPYRFSDTVGYVVIFVFLGIIFWLSVHESDQLLEKARLTERKLERERDNLEAHVAERTAAIELIHSERLQELERFAVFGQNSAHIMHDLVNLITAAGISIEQALPNQKSTALEDAHQCLTQIQRYVTLARQQLDSTTDRVEFDIQSEVVTVLQTLEPLIKSRRIKVSLDLHALTIFGNPVKFRQIVINLLTNAIQAYSQQATRRTLAIGMALTTEQNLKLSFHNWGKTIPRVHITKIFTPYYSSRADESVGMGLGLVMVKRFVENEFNGTVQVTSSPQTGTTLMLHFPLKKPANLELQGR